jgi:hypothetical protein
VSLVWQELSGALATGVALIPALDATFWRTRARTGSALSTSISVCPARSESTFDWVAPPVKTVLAERWPDEELGHRSVARALRYWKLRGTP